MFTEQQVKQLNAMLDGGSVKQRTQGKATVSYLEGYAAIEAANRIFGYGKWQGKIVSLEQAELSEVTSKDGRKGHRVAYTCVYEVTVRGSDGEVTFTDIGYGSGTTYNGIGEGVESATKEAVTDAMKRALRNFGNQFGLALYDKEKRNVDDGRFNAQAARDAIVALPGATIDDARAALATSDRDELVNLYRAVQARQGNE